MKTVAQLLRSKGHDVLFVGPETAVFDALQLMAEKNVGAVLVLEGQRLVGIFSERDYSRGRPPRTPRSARS
jgi:CBS domain-containing protein